MDYRLNFDAVWRNFDLLLSGLGSGVGAGRPFDLPRQPDRTGRGLRHAFREPGAAVDRRELRYGDPQHAHSRAYLSSRIFALPEAGSSGLGKIESFVFTLTFYAGAYLTEVFRGGLVALPRGLREAGLAIGMTEWRTRIWIIIPVMIRNVLPALSNNFISLFKDTSLAAAIAVPELTFYARQINVNTFRVIESWTVASLMYVCACYVIAAGLRRVERKLAIPR